MDDILNNKCDLLFDFYELAMANGFLKTGIDETVAWFDMFYRPAKEIGGFCVMAGVRQFAEYIKNLSFSEDDLSFLKSKGMDDAFIDYLRNFRFSCDIWAVEEGTPIFANEPVVKVRGPVIQALLLETVILLSVNHQSLIATKANRIVRAAAGREIIEIGSRRAHGINAALNGARSAYIGGTRATTSVAAAKIFDIPVFASMSHSWVQMFDSEYEAFCAYARAYPDNCVLLIDTYDTMGEGIVNAIKAFDDVLAPMNKRPRGVRIDSGDLAYLSKKIRRALNDAGYPDCNIYASNSLDEYIIRDMLQNGARVDSFLVGERLITSASSPVMGGVYKLSAIEKDGKIIPKIKISENVAKITTPYPKLLWRLFDNETGKAIADVITMEDEDLSNAKTYELFDPDYTWKRKTVSEFVARQLLVKIFENGELVYKFPRTDKIRSYCAEQIDTLWEEVLRFEYPHNYYVDLSQKLWNEKQKLIDSFLSR
ncbi:MAG: nicotinate phosphoribosyltransferase [Clostridia bacterium]|nr:nicotinate phosphoribosyltransferase [Clostridia bacterium]